MSMIPNNAPAFNLAPHQRPGTIVSTQRLIYRHFGILTDRLIDGHPAVISNSGEHGKVVEEPLNKFRGNGDLRIEGYPGTLPQHVVLERARAKLGTQYSLINWNCEQFVRYAHGFKPESPQLATMASLVVVALVVYRLTKA